MNHIQSRLLFLGGILMLCAIVLGVFGAHLLSARIGSQDLENFKTANQYHRIHALLFLVLVPISKWLNKNEIRALVWIFGLAILFFSGFLYFHSTSELLTGNKQQWAAAVIPFGGVGFIIGWSYLTYLGWRKLKLPEAKD